jgi:hypothetical protein
MPVNRSALRRTLLARYRWLESDHIGPQAVEAGECDACGAEPRLVAPCGPPPARMQTRAGPDWALGRRCAARLGVEAWCAGHEEEAAAALRWLARLPAEADDVARLWWVATGEVRLDPALLERVRRRVLPRPPG